VNKLGNCGRKSDVNESGVGVVLVLLEEKGGGGRGFLALLDLGCCGCRKEFEMGVLCFDVLLRVSLLQFRKQSHRFVR
jgi:hypothetical protein